MKHYYALFKETSEAIEVEFPDLPGCVTFGSNWEEAYDNAIDVLAGWLASAESQFIKEPSSHQHLKNSSGTLIPIPIEESIIESYQQSKRINVIFPTKTLNKIDLFRKSVGIKRSTFLTKASEEYLKRHFHNSSETKNKSINS